MFAGWWRTYANIALTGGNLIFLLIALKFPTPGGIGLAAGLVGISSLFAWYLNLNRYSAVADTPTSRIASAAQGFVEIIGKGVHPFGDRLVSPITGLPCLWYHYIIEEKTGKEWRRTAEGVSTELLGINDGSGLALTDPHDAEIVTSHKAITTRGIYRYTEWTLIEGEILYVLGEHATIGGANMVHDFKRDVSDLLADWKRDKPSLLQRFDLDHDNRINLEEWELARKAAHREIEREHQAARFQQGTHMLRKSAGRLYLIANRLPEHLAARYRWWAWTHLGFVIIACMAVASLL